MKKSFLNIAKVMMPFGLAFGMIACTTTEDGTPVESESRVALRATADQNVGGENSRVDVGAMSVTEFQVGTQDVEMRYAAKSEIGAGINLGNISLSTNLNAELGTSASQPKSNLLIQNGEHQTAVIGEGRTPDGTYTEITFDLYQNTNVEQDHFAYGKSLYIIGEVNNTPTRIWFETEEELRATSRDTGGYAIDGDADLWLYFDLQSMFNGVDFSAATDADADGFIDIGPNDVDGNGDIHAAIRANLDSSVEFVK
ncbi:hypothetical protein KIH41_12080 [Litoribacter ruber]|uniref:hypothetical protein n=1 Tax=Litoribacter ruber TaxID=702568 RepID=UPI001BDA88FB|nr:hypothetical protein [Litoribacter ruber]MBT0812018.1 hypothetical protein [Litoribacter ruber]